MKKASHSPLFPQVSSKAVFALGVTVPFFIFLFAYIINNIFPFGDKILMDADSFHQYLPFLTEFRRKLLNGDSFFYSFSGGLGYNFWASFSYYASSPLNFLLVLIPESNVCDFIVWMTVLKVSLCGGILSWYLSKQNGNTSLFAVSFGTMYAFSNYLVSYKYNFMWLDSIAVVPLVMYGLEKLVRREHPGCYLISLFYAIWCNYYIGYMICLFSCLYLVFLFVTEEINDKKQILNSCIVFTVSSLAAGGMSAILLFPSFLALRSSTAMVVGESSGIQFYNNFLSMFRAHYMDSEAFRISYNRGDVHLYCGMLVFPLAALYFSDHGIRKKERLAYAIFLGFLLFSFSFSPLTFMWHGFHNQTALPNRFSFLYNLLLLRLTYSVLPRLQATEERRLNFVILGIFILSVFFMLWDYITENSSHILLSLGFLAFYTVLLYEIRSHQKNIKQCALVLCILIILEAGTFELIDLSINGIGWRRSKYINYQQDYQTLISNQNEEDFFRSDVDTNISNFITFVGGNGISLFNSTMQDSVCRFLGGLNLPSELNTVINTGGTKLVNDLLGVRYIVTENTDSDTWNGFAKVSTLNGKSLYKNDNALSIGFMVPEEITSWSPVPGNGMTGQNDLARILCGVDEMFPLVMEYTGEILEPYPFEIPDNAALFVTIDEEPLELTWNTPEYTRKYEKWFQYMLLPAQATENSSLASLSAVTSHLNYTGKVYSCRDEDYTQVLQALSKNQLKNVDVDGNHISGSIVVDQSGILLLTVPYNLGWQISVDGKPTAFEEIGGALIGIPLQQGEHSIQMHFIPQGITAGCILSLASLLLAFAVLFFLRKPLSSDIRYHWNEKALAK